MMNSRLVARQTQGHGRATDRSRRTRRRRPRGALPISGPTAARRRQANRRGHCNSSSDFRSGPDRRRRRPRPKRGCSLAGALPRAYCRRTNLSTSNNGRTMTRHEPKPLATHCGCTRPLTRREMLRGSAAGFASLALAGLLARRSVRGRRANPLRRQAAAFSGHGPSG